MGFSNTQDQQIQHQLIQKVIEVKPKDEGSGHNIVHFIIDFGGVWWLLGFAVLGFLGRFRNHIRKWLGIK